MATLRKRRRKLKGENATYWVVDYSVTENGRTRRKQRHFRVDPDSPQEARLAAEELKAEVERKIARRKRLGGSQQDDGPVDVEVADWLDAFCRAVRPNCSDAYHRIVVYTLKKFRELAKGKGIETTLQLRRQLFSDHVAAMLKKGNKPKSIHNDLSIIKRAIQWGIDEGCLDPSLVRGFPSVKVPKKKRRVLTTKEIEELLDAAEGTELYEPIIVALYTGARRGELVQMRCSDIDMGRGVINFRAEITKAGRDASLPIHSRLRDLFQRRAGQAGFLVTRQDGSPWKPGPLTRAFSALVQDGLGWDGVTFHCLRHTFGTLLAASGKISPFELTRLMRHRSITTSMIYVNLANQKLPSIDVF